MHTSAYLVVEGLAHHAQGEEYEEAHGVQQIGLNSEQHVLYRPE
jgi:hypothetical protein